MLLSAPTVAQTKLPDLPDVHGRAGMFAGISHGTLLVAGGANFPERKPWEGGTKAWYDTVYALETNSSAWKIVGKLPQSLGYGVSATYDDGVVIIGGADATKHYAEGQVLKWKDGRLTSKSLPDLPQSLAYGCGALIGSKLYVSGGQTAPDTPAINSLYRIDLASAEPKWEVLKDCPGPGRMLAAAAVQGQSLIIAGGVTLVKDEQGQLQRKYLDTVYSYDDQEGWKELAKLPRPSTAAPSPCPNTKRGFLLLGGDDGSQLGVDPTKHEGFRKEFWEYDAAKNSWSVFTKTLEPRVTTPCVLWNDLYVVPSGEIAPGRRTPTMMVIEFPRAHGEER